MAGHDWEAIKAGTDIAAVIGGYVPLKRNGNLQEACCPFHQEKSPSFKVYDDHYHCFGCGEHGDAIDFVMAMDGCDAREAIERIGGGHFKPNGSFPRVMKDRKAEQEAAQLEATKAALGRFIASTEIDPGHPYLARKKIASHMARAEGRNIILPVHAKNGRIQSVQTIGPDGGKLFAPGAPMKSGRLNIGIFMGRVILCEGFATGASLFEATADQVMIAFSKGNMACLARELHESGTPFVIAADNNALAEMRKLGAELGCPAFAPPAEYDDFNDLAVARGNDAVALAVAAGIREYVAPPAAPKETDPIDLWARAAAPGFPHGLLPDVIERFALTRARMIGVDPSGVAMAALTSCAAVITDRIKLKVKQHDDWKESARLWCMVIGEPSHGKSTILGAAAGKVSAMDAAMMRKYQDEFRNWRDMGENGAPPIPTRLRIDDITMEAAQNICANSPDGVLALQDELSGWFGGIEKYSGGKGGAKDRSFWLRAYNGGHYSVDRVQRKEATLIENLSISILGGIQPDAIARVAADSTDDGLIQRFIPIILQTSDVGRDEEMPDVAFEYDALVDRLHALSAPETILGDAYLHFSDGARAIREGLEKKHYDMVRAVEHINRKLASHLGKFNGMFVRLCVLWHCIEHIDGDMPLEVSEATAQRVATFLHQFIFRHSMAFYSGILGLSANQEILCDVAGYILAHEEHEAVTTRIFMRGSMAMKRVGHEDRTRILEELTEFGWLEPIDKRGRGSGWKVRDGVREFFRDKAEEEKRRRAEGIEIIRAMTNGDSW